MRNSDGKLEERRRGSSAVRLTENWSGSLDTETREDVLTLGRPKNKESPVSFSVVNLRAYLATIHPDTSFRNI